MDWLGKSMIGIFFTILIPAIFLYVVWSLEIYAMSRLPLLLASAAWGLLAFAIAYVVQNFMLNAQFADYTQITLISAPILEEILKLILIFALTLNLSLRYAADGAVYGFCAGIAFAVAENVLYISHNPDQSLEIALSRVLSVSLMHAFNSAFVGAICGLHAHQGLRARAQSITFGMILVEFNHFVFNLVSTHVYGWSLTLFSITVGLGGIGLLILIIRHALHAESQLIEHMLTENVSAGERAAVLHPEQLTQILVKNHEVFDRHSVQIIQRYVALKSHEGILKRTILLNQRHKHHAALERQLQSVQLQLNGLRSEMGLYTWIWLRTVLPSDDDAIWHHLDDQLHTDHPALDLLIKLNVRREEIYPGELGARVSLLKRTLVFQDLDHDDLQDLALSLTEERFTLGQIIIEQGEVADKLYSIACGSVAVSITGANDRVTKLWEHTRGDIFGQFSMIDLQPHPATVVCLEDTVVYTLPREEFFTLIYAKPQLALGMMKKVLHETRQGAAALSAVSASAVA